MTLNLVWYFPIDNKIIPTNIPYDIKKFLAELNKLRDKIPNFIKTAQDSQFNIRAIFFRK